MSPSPESMELNQAEGCINVTRVFPRTRARVIHNNYDDYETRYPEDSYLEEMGPNARVWRTYLDESRVNDENMLGGWNESADVLLVFAGLFSAVVTTFVVQSSQALQQDYTYVTASLLTELVLIQRAIATGGSISNIAPSSLTVSSTFSANPLDRWVNGLWFTSLALSLVVALMAVLIKQWLKNYSRSISGSASDQVKLRKFRYIGLQKWKVRAIVGSLPVLLHISLLIFFAGLVLFLIPLDVAFPWIITGLAVLSYFIYIISPILSLKYPECPYKSPLTAVAEEIATLSSSMSIAIISWFGDLLEYLNIPVITSNSIGFLRRLIRASTKYGEREAINDLGLVLSLQALEELRQSSTNSSLRSVTLEAYSAMAEYLDDETWRLVLGDSQLLSELRHAFFSCFLVEPENKSKARLIEGRGRKAERFARALLSVQLADTGQITVYDSWHADCWRCLCTIEDNPQAVALAVLFKSAGFYYYREGYTYHSPVVGEIEFTKVALKGDILLPSWVWERLKVHVTNRDLKECFRSEEEMLDSLNSLVSILQTLHDTAQIQYIALVLHAIGCPLQWKCPELDSPVRNTKALVFHALVGVLGFIDQRGSLTCCQHLHQMIVDNLEVPLAEDTMGSGTALLFKSFEENLLDKLEIEFEARFLGGEFRDIQNSTSKGLQVIPDLCYELHHRVRPDYWNELLLKKALCCLSDGWELTRSMSVFLEDCFKAGLPLSVVKVFEEYEGINALWQQVRSKHTRERVLTNVSQFYVTAAQTVDTRPTNWQIGHPKILLTVIETIFRCLLFRWSEMHRRNQLKSPVDTANDRRRQTDDNLISNFELILVKSYSHSKLDLWQNAVSLLSRLSKENPPPYELLDYFVPMFEKIEELKWKLKVEGPEYDLYIYMGAGDSNPYRQAVVRYETDMFIALRLGNPEIQKSGKSPQITADAAVSPDKGHTSSLSSEHGKIAENTASSLDSDSLYSLMRRLFSWEETDEGSPV